MSRMWYRFGLSLAALPARQYGWQALRALGKDCSGAVGPTLGLVMLLLAGFAGLGVEVSKWYVTRRTMQGASDSAAYSAATAMAAGETQTAYTSEANSVAASYGFINGSNGVTVTVTPTTWNSSNAVEVTITQLQSITLASLYLPSPPTIRAAAVATVNSTGCVLALDRGSVTDVTDSGATVLNLNSCNLYVNAPDSRALVLSGSAEINANVAYISGNYSMSGAASLNTTDGTHTGVAPTADPYANVPIPSYEGCNQTNFSLSGSQTKTLSVGSSGVMVFCNGLSLSGASQLTLDPGIYIIDRGSLSISGGSSISGSGVTIVLTISTGQNYATASVSGGSTVNISAPDSGPTAGMAFFQDRNAPSTGSDSVSGGATQNINGAIYFPNQNLNFSGGTATGGATCTQLIALTFTFSGSSNFNNSNCAGTGVLGIGGSARLVE